MGDPLGSVGAITLFVDDPERSGRFYASALGAQAVFEDDESVALRVGDLLVNLLRRGRPVQELLGPVPAAPPGVGAAMLLTIGVDDVDAACAALAARGVAIAHGPLDRPWGMRTASFLDPDGHAWEVAARIRADRVGPPSLAHSGGWRVRGPSSFAPPA